MSYFFSLVRRRRSVVYKVKYGGCGNRFYKRRVIDVVSSDVCLFLFLCVLFVLASSLNGSHGEYTNSDDVTLWFIVLFVVCCALSGSHGEWTNEDDMEQNARRRLDGFQAERRRAHNRNRHLNPAPYRHGQVLYGPNPDQINYYRDLDWKNEHLEEKDKKRLINVSGYEPERIIRVQYGLGWDGRQVYTLVNNRYIGFDGVQSTYFVANDEPVVGRGGDIGWCFAPVHVEQDFADRVHEFNVKDIVLKSPFKRYSFDSYSYLGQHIQGKTGLAFLPALKDLSKELPSCGRLDSARVKAVLAFVKKRYFPAGLTDDLIHQTVEYWLHREHLHRSGVLESTNTTRLIGLGVVNEADDGFVRTCEGLGIATQFSNDYRRPGIECEIPNEFAVKDTFSVTFFGAHYDENGYPVFDTNQPDPDYCKYWATQYCKFSAHGRNFLLYDVTPNNAAKALKRLIGARDQEDVYYSNQASLLRTFCSMGYIDPVILETLNVRFAGMEFKSDRDWYTGFFVDMFTRVTRPFPVLVAPDPQLHEVGRMVVGHGVNHHIVPTDPAVHAPYTKYWERACRKIHDRMERSALERVVTSTLGPNWLYYAGFMEYLQHMDTDKGRLTNAEIKHVKKALRRAYVYDVYLRGQGFHHDSDIMVSNVNACVKKELAKFGKVPRLFVSYDAGCMYANEMPEILKAALSEVFSFEKGELNRDYSVDIFILSKMREDSMSQVFEAAVLALDRPGHMNVIIYSDDSVYSGMTPAGVKFGCNVDITSCDTSNNSLVFAFTGTLLSYYNQRRACGLVKQCMLPITLTNPYKKDEKMVFRFHSAFEGSGTVLTTVLNHCASYLIAVSTAIVLRPDFRPEVSIVEGAMLVGHKVTVDSWVKNGSPIIEKMQFLKMSPIYSTCGKIIPTLNYAAIFRSFGTVEGDMTCDMLCLDRHTFNQLPVADRMDRFLTGVVKGLKHEPSSRIMDALRGRFNLDCETNVPSRYEEEMLRAVTAADRENCNVVLANTRSQYVLDEASLQRRYDFDACGVDELVEHIHQCKLGSLSVTHAMTRMFLLDYGVEIDELPPLLTT